MGKIGGKRRVGAVLVWVSGQRWARQGQEGEDRREKVEGGRGKGDHADGVEEDEGDGDG